MKKIILICLLGGLISLTVYSQEGFNKTYGQDWAAGIFTALEMVEDTVFAVGVAREHNEPMWGLLVGRLDTLGNWLDYHIHYDEEGNEFAGSLSYRNLIKLSDGSGFALAGSFFYQTENYFIKLDNQGQITFFKRYIDDRPEYSFTRFSQIIEIEDGYLVRGTRAHRDSSGLETFVIRMDEDGEFIWEQSFRASNERHYMGSIVVKDSTDYFITGITDPVNPNLPPSQLYYTTLMTGFNLDGEKLWSFESEPTTEEQGAVRIHFTKDSNYIYPSLKPIYNEEFNVYSYQPVIVIRDQDFNLIERKYYYPDDRERNYFTRFIELEDGGWLTLGIKPYEYPREPYFSKYNAIAGWMMRLDEEVETVWSRLDTAKWSLTMGSENYLRDAVVLPSGSIIACGISRDRDLFRDSPWLIKVDKDGCMYSGDCGTFITSTEEVLEDSRGLTVYPNPASEMVHFKLNFVDTGQGPYTLRIYNLSGIPVEEKSGLRNNQEYHWTVHNYPPGVYFYQLSSQNKIQSGKLLIAR